nr:MAG: hypothetical protein [uncultured archaeon]
MISELEINKNTNLLLHLEIPEDITIDIEETINYLKTKGFKIKRIINLII